MDPIIILQFLVNRFVFFLVAMLYRFGVMSFGASPRSQRLHQNFPFWPLPMLTTVAAWNSCLSIVSQGTSVPTHGFELFFHTNYNHLSRSARPKFSKSKIPSPPSFFGRHTLAHLTKHWQPLAWSHPFHRNVSFDCLAS